ncbi:DUF5691 domain-containing protein [Thermopolyspora sp. NPDC052614]|uniref:DUF5691 domain-containing protein n=1 Tax=Thermopolyspora sp. NPDC052614 TaxID=3155682 RepID=UPI00342C6FF8
MISRAEASSDGGVDWAELVSAALVGTDRRPVPGLLGKAAVEVVRRRAGQRLHRGEPLPSAPGEDRPLVPSAAGERLARILSGERSRLLHEWLEAAAARGLRVPAETIPRLLDHGAKDRSARSWLGVVTGARGRWLAGLNPDWSYLLQEAAGDAAGLGPDVWELGTGGDRRAHLAGLRAADPAAARELLARGWAKETPEDRAAFIAVFDDGLSPDDEPFLEAALDDRRREVRQQAADLLTRLPGSRLGERMAERGRRCLARERGRLVIEPPEECDAAMERDGVRARAPRGTGERAWWLQQVIARTPLSVWESHLGGSPDRIREWLDDDGGDWGREVRRGLVRAVVLQRDRIWARALLQREPVADVIAVLPPEERAREVASIIRGAVVDGQLIMLLGGIPGPWTGPLASAVLEKIRHTSGVQPWNTGELCRLAGERIDPALHEHARDVDSDLAAVLRFRFDMHRELARATGGDEGGTGERPTAAR